MCIVKIFYGTMRNIILLILLLVVSATVFVVFISKIGHGFGSFDVNGGGGKYGKNARDLHKDFTVEEETEEDDDEDDTLFQETCPYGFDFLEKEDFSIPKRHHLLPANHNKNFSGALFNRDLICLDTMDASIGQWVGFYECHGQGRNQMITFAQNGQIVSDESTLCLAIKNLISDEVVLKKCDHGDETQIWATESYLGWVLPFVKTHYCLTAPEKELDPLTISLCKETAEPQRWQHTIQEVLSLWISGTFHRKKHSSRKLKEGRAKVNKVLLHSQNSFKENDLLFG